MASLKEIKNRIASVKSTLKITSAMKLVSSAKLRKAQAAIEGMLPYQAALRATLASLAASGNEKIEKYSKAREVHHVTLLCLASNSSLCSGFNANAVRAVRERVAELRAAGVAVDVIAVGRKMVEAVRALGFPQRKDYSELSAKPSYDEAAALASSLADSFLDGKTDRVELIYNHFVSTASQKVVQEEFLPLTSPAGDSENALDDEYIIEPDRDSLLEILLPKTLKLKVYTVLLDSSAAEHAARTVAMQTASDNAEDLLQELSLEYNKGRQQKITNELLDLAGGLA